MTPPSPSDKGLREEVARIINRLEAVATSEMARAGASDEISDAANLAVAELRALLPAISLSREGWRRLRDQAFALSCEDQHALAEAIAGNVGYELTPEPEHPDSPHALAALPSGMGGSSRPGPVAQATTGAGADD